MPAGSLPTKVDNPYGLRMVACGLIILAFLRLIPLLSAQGFHNDFSHYYLGGWMYANGINAYTEPLATHCEKLGIESDPTIPYAAHPPLILAMFSLLSNLTPKMAYGVWLVAQFGIFAAFLEVTRRLLGWRWNEYTWLVVVAIFCNSTSVQRLFYYSQIQVLVGLVAYLALVAHLRRRHILACGLITLAAAFKIYPIVLLPWFLCAGIRSLPDVAKRAGIVCAVAITSVALAGVSTWTDFVTIGVPGLSDNAVKWTNVSAQSLVFQLSRTPLAESLTELTGNHTQAIAILASLSVITMAYLAVLVCRPQPRVAFCVLLAAATIGGVITWSHYLTLLLLPVALLWKTAAGLKSQGARVFACLAGVLVIMPQLDLMLFAVGQTVPRVLLHFYPFFAAIVVCVLLLKFSEIPERSQS